MDPSTPRLLGASTLPVLLAGLLALGAPTAAAAQDGPSLDAGFRHACALSPGGMQSKASKWSSAKTRSATCAPWVI